MGFAGLFDLQGSEALPLTTLWGGTKVSPCACAVQSTVRTATLTLARSCSSIWRNKSHILWSFWSNIRWNVFTTALFLMPLIRTKSYWVSTQSLTGRCPLGETSIQSSRSCPASHQLLVRCRTCAVPQLHPLSSCSLPPLQCHSSRLWSAATLKREKCRFRERGSRLVEKRLSSHSLCSVVCCSCTNIFLHNKSKIISYY